MSGIILNTFLILASILIVTFIFAGVALLLVIKEVVGIAKNIRRITQHVDVGTLRILSTVLGFLKR